MKRASRVISLLTVLMMVVTCLCGFGTTGVFAADSTKDVALSVYDSDVLVKEYTLDDLKAIAAAEGNKKYKYSGYNRNPSFYTFGDPDNEKTPSREDVKECIGPTVEGILADAGISYNDNQLITILGNDGYGTKALAGDIFGERYYYPNGSGIKNGETAKEEHYIGAELTPAIIDIYDDSPETEYVDTVLRFGQKAPNERNNTFFAKYVAAGGKIIVGDEVSEQWESVHTPIYKSGTVLPETAIEFDTKYISNKYASGTVYYTVNYSNDGKTPEGIEPKAGDAIYNYDKYEGTNPPVLEQEGIYTIKVKVIGYGFLDSETTTFTYKVEDVESPEDVKSESFTAKASGYDSIKLSWKTVSDADGYEVMRANTKGTYEAIATTTAESYEDTSLITGTEYKYRVRAYKLLDSGQKVYSNGTAVKTATPYLTKPTISSAVRKSYNSIQIKWSAIAGATGYYIYRYDAVTKKYTYVKEVTSGSIVSYTNTGLKTGRKYTYKVKAYRTLEDGTTVVSSLSSGKAATPYLTKPTVKLTAGKKSITVKWSKISGATGYKIYRSTKKSSGYKLVKTIKKGSTVCWKNSKLTKNKKYYYKIKAYRIVDKKYVYSSISSLKYTKAK